MAEPHFPESGASGGPDPFAAMFSAWSALASGLAPPAGSAPPGTAEGDAGAQIAAVLAQAQGAAATALMRLWQRGAQSWSEYGAAALAAAAPQASQAPAALDGVALGRTLDAARAHLQRLAGMAHDEASALELQLRALDEQLRAVAAAPVSPADPAPPPRRRARAKP